VGFQYQLSDWRVYSSEQAVGHDEPLDAVGAQALVVRAMSSTWWSEWFPHAVPVEVRIGGRETTEISGIKHIWSWSTPDAYPTPTKYFIELHPRMLTARVVLHELAHCVSPSFIVEDIKDRVGRPAGMLRREHMTHGPCFTAALSIITDNMLPGDDGQLAEAYRHFEVPIASHDELREQVLGQPAVVEERQAFIDEVRRDSEELKPSMNRSTVIVERPRFRRFHGGGIYSTTGGRSTVDPKVGCCLRRSWPRKSRKSRRARPNTSRPLSTRVKGPPT
jgi:hypothetical protein